MNTSIYNNVTNFLKKRTLELLGFLLILCSIILLVAFITYSPNDPSLVYGKTDILSKNFFGTYGSWVSDFLLQSFGIVSFLILLTLTSWGIELILKKKLNNIFYKILYMVLYLIFGCVFVYNNFNNSFWLIDNGNSGFIGQILYNFMTEYVSQVENNYINSFLVVLTLLFFILSTNLRIDLFYILLKNILSI